MHTTVNTIPLEIVPREVLQISCAPQYPMERYSMLNPVVSIMRYYTQAQLYMAM